MSNDNLTMDERVYPSPRTPCQNACGRPLGMHHELRVIGTPRSEMTWWECRNCGNRWPRGMGLFYRPADQRRRWREGDEVKRREFMTAAAVAVAAAAVPVILREHIGNAEEFIELLRHPGARIIGRTFLFDRGIYMRAAPGFVVSRCALFWPSELWNKFQDWHDDQYWKNHADEYEMTMYRVDGSGEDQPEPAPLVHFSDECIGQINHCFFGYADSRTEAIDMRAKWKDFLAGRDDPRIRLLS